MSLCLYECVSEWANTVYIDNSTTACFDAQLELENCTTIECSLPFDEPLSVSNVTLEDLSSWTCEIDECIRDCIDESLPAFLANPCDAKDDLFDCLRSSSDVCGNITNPVDTGTEFDSQALVDDLENFSNEFCIDTTNSTDLDLLECGEVCISQFLVQIGFSFNETNSSVICQAFTDLQICLDVDCTPEAAQVLETLVQNAILDQLEECSLNSGNSTLSPTISPPIDDNITTSSPTGSPIVFLNSTETPTISINVTANITLTPTSSPNIIGNITLSPTMSTTNATSAPTISMLNDTNITLSPTNAPTILNLTNSTGSPTISTSNNFTNTPTKAPTSLNLTNSTGSPTISASNNFTNTPTKAPTVLNLTNSTGSPTISTGNNFTNTPTTAPTMVMLNETNTTIMPTSSPAESTLSPTMSPFVTSGNITNIPTSSPDGNTFPPIFFDFLPACADPCTKEFSNNLKNILEPTAPVSKADCENGTAAFECAKDLCSSAELEVYELRLDALCGEFSLVVIIVAIVLVVAAFIIILAICFGAIVLCQRRRARKRKANTELDNNGAPLVGGYPATMLSTGTTNDGYTVQEVEKRNAL